MKEHGRGSAGWRYPVLCAALLSLGLTCVSALGGPGQVKAESAQSVEQYRALMVNARQMYPYPQSVEKMYRVMMCESGGNPRASGQGGAHLGLFQYAPATWRGSWNPYRYSSMWDTKAQIYATAKAWSIGMQGRWSCYYMTAGR